MSEEELMQMASQLRKPEGETGIKTGEWMNAGNLQMNRDTLRVLQVKDGDVILEIGMGNGLFVKEILEDKPLTKYTGCDFSEDMVREAKKINTRWISNGQAQFIHCNVNSLPIASESCDKIFTVNTIYFWEDHSAVLNELKRVLKRGGSLILALRPKHQMMHYPFTKYGFTLFSKEEVTALLEKNNFAVEKVFENPEPDFEIQGEVVKMENMVVVAVKK